MLYLYDNGLGVNFSIGNVRLLRVLDLLEAYNYDLAEEVFELFHLRYLAFNCGFSISEAISNLVNLQTLMICPRQKNIGMFDKLPEGIWRMPQLRHLFIFLLVLPSQIERTPALENLQTLSAAVDFMCSRKNLKLIPNLRKPTLFYTKNLRDVVQNYELRNLKYLYKLEEVEFERCGTCWDVMKNVGLLSRLQVLKLRNNACIGDTWETSERGFSELSFLLIEESNLKNWITKSSHFPRLKSIVLLRCWRMMEIPEDIGKIPKLKLIELDDYNHSLLLSARRIQKLRKSLGYGSLHVRAI